MSFFVVAFIYPLLLATMTLGAGLLVENLAGMRLPTALVPAAGFGAMIVVTQLTVLAPAIAPLSPVILAVVVLAGYAFNARSLRARWLARGSGWFWLPLAGVAAYVTVAMPLIAAGQLTFPGYLLDTTAGFQLAAGEWMLHHGAPLPAPYPAYGAMLQDYWGTGYPSGGQVLLATTGWLSGQDLLWLIFPFQVFALALSALELGYLASRAGLSRVAAAFAGWIAAVPALVAAYAMMGSIKELTALPELLLMGALIVLARERSRAGVRGLVPFAVAAAGAIGAIGPSAAAWIGGFGLVVVIFLFSPLRDWVSNLRRKSTLEPRRWALIAAGTVVVLGILLLSVSARLSSAVQTALSLSSSVAGRASDPGNLLRPLRFVQVFGIWLGGSHRVDPTYAYQTYALIGVAILAFILGCTLLVRRRNWALLAFMLASLVIWGALYERGTEWTDAKVMMLTSPVVVLVVMIGAFGDLRAQRLQGLLLAVIVGAGVLASNFFLYHGTNLAPGARFSELRSIGQRFADQGPTLLPDFDEYTFYVLRKLDVDSPGFAGDMRRPFALFSGAPQYGHSYDVDDIEAPFVQDFNLIVARRSPLWSRPPGNFKLVWEGRYYDVWRRFAPAPVFHMPAGLTSGPLGKPPCPSIANLAKRARRVGGELRYAARPPDVAVNLRAMLPLGSVAPTVDGNGLPSLSWGGAGIAELKTSVPATATYGVWLGGDVDRPLDVIVDGQNVGAVAHQSGGDGNMMLVGSIHLAAGRHVIALSRGGAGTAPGTDSGALIDGIYLQRVGPEGETVTTVPASDWRSLCGRTVDWIEIT